MLYMNIFVFILILITTLQGSENDDSNGFLSITPDSFPLVNGTLVFHSYKDYGSADGKLFIFNFASDTLVEISEGWNLQHTINGHFLPNGTELVFMALPKGHTSYNDWNIYLWKVGSQYEPENLTPFNNIPDEDPKFFLDGQRVVFKQNGDIKIIDLSTKQITDVTSDGFSVEESMPYPTADGEHIVYAKNSKIYMINVDGTNDRSLTTENNLGCYYPIVRDMESFFYPRWASPINHHDEVYLGNFQTGVSLSCPFNRINFDDSDPFPVKDTDYVFFSSNRNGGQGSWDIYLGHLQTGQVWSLDQFGINSSKSELGSAYYIMDTTLVDEPVQNMVSDFILNQNYPNPFNPITAITYQIAAASWVDLSIYNTLGKKVTTLIAEKQKEGIYTIKWNATGFASGVYIYKIETDKGFTAAKKMILIR
jgi:hypothetical protein